VTRGSSILLPPFSPQERAFLAARDDHHAPPRKWRQNACPGPGSYLH
jgi:hypothetical protein